MSIMNDSRFSLIRISFFLSFIFALFQSCGPTLISQEHTLSSTQDAPTDPLIIPDPINSAPPPEETSSESDPQTLHEWAQFTLRSKEQKEAGVAGGEGFQAVQDIDFSSSDPNVLYLVVDTSGVWKSTDGGQHWRVKPNGFRTNGGLGLTIHPKNPNIVFVAGSDMPAGYQSPPGALKGIVRTIDGGNSWVLVKQVEITRERRSKGADLFAYSGENIVYAGTHGSGLLKSSDLGKTWTIHDDWWSRHGWNL